MNNVRYLYFILLVVVQDGFPATEWCSAYGVVMFNDHVVASCPSECSKITKNQMMLSTHNGRCQSDIALPSDNKLNLKDMRIQYCYHVTPMVVVLSKSVSFRDGYGIIVDGITGQMVGSFEHKAQKKGNFVPFKYHRYCLSSDQRNFCAILQYMPKGAALWTTGNYDILLYTKMSERNVYVLSRKICNIEHVHREGPVSLLPPGFDNEKLLLVNTQFRDNNSPKLICDISYITGNVTKAISYSDIPVANDMDWENWVIQNVVCNRTGTVVAVCCEVTTEDNIHNSRTFLFQLPSLSLLNILEFTTPLLIKDNISNWRIKGCYQNVTPIFSHCGSKIAIMNCDSASSRTGEPSNHLKVHVYTLPTAKSLQKICHVAILKHVRSHSDINLLPLPVKMLNQLHCY